jgi:hypothetical protein
MLVPDSEYRAAHMPAKNQMGMKLSGENIPAKKATDGEKGQVASTKVASEMYNQMGVHKNVQSF